MGKQSTLFVPNQPNSRQVKSIKLCLPFQLRFAILYPFSPSAPLKMKKRIRGLGYQVNRRSGCSAVRRPVEIQVIKISGKRQRTEDGRRNNHTPPYFKGHELNACSPYFMWCKCSEHKKRLMTPLSHQSLLFHCPVYGIPKASPQLCLITLKEFLIIY